MLEAWYFLIDILMFLLWNWTTVYASGKPCIGGSCIAVVLQEYCHQDGTSWIYQNLSWPTRIPATTSVGDLQQCLIYFQMYILSLLIAKEASKHHEESFSILFNPLMNILQ